MSTRETSKAAYESVKPFRNCAKRRILEHLAPGLWITCEQLEIATGLKHQTCSARIGELRDPGHIMDSGWKGRTSSGRAAVAWTITLKGLEAIK